MADGEYIGGVNAVMRRESFFFFSWTVVKRRDEGGTPGDMQLQADGFLKLAQ